ncbi:MAG TPA: FtsX-like permease family protein, partial [Gemmatimonadaceae bacterium]|nr:FtsX-like permease family protein [Gemmatimonadaceae bacterium]
PGWFSFRIGALETQGESAAPNGTTSFINANTTEPSYFQTMGIRFVEGSTFDDTTATSRQVIVNEGYARKHWPRGGAVGHRLRIAYNGKGDWYTIVGVVNDVAASGPMTDASAPMLYYPASDHQQKALLVRTNGLANPLTALRSLVAAVDSRLMVDVESARQTAAASIAEPRFVMALLAVFTALALVLAAVGLYGVMSYTVAQRTREIGIRIALGSPRGRIARLIVIRGLALAVIGAAIGLGVSAWGSKLIASSLYGITRSDPASFIAGAVVLVAVALAACVIPTRRALAVDPVSAIRAD